MLKKALATAGAVLVPSLALAQEGSTVTVQTPEMDTIISTGDLQTNLLNTVSPWVSMGLSIGFTIFAVWVGYRLIRRFIR